MELFEGVCYLTFPFLFVDVYLKWPSVIVLWQELFCDSITVV